MTDRRTSDKNLSNYEIMKRRMALEFLKYDQKEMIRKYSLDHDQDYLHIEFFSRSYRIGRKNGMVEWSPGQKTHDNAPDFESRTGKKTRDNALDFGSGTGKKTHDNAPDFGNGGGQKSYDNAPDFWNSGGQIVEADYNEAMTIYDILCCAKPYSSLSGEFINMRSLSSVQGSSAISDGGFFDRAVAPFDGKEAALSRACERLGGVKAGKGDVAYRIPMFPFFPVVFQFWNSDEEFPPTLELLMDRNTLQYMHYETVWFAVSHMLARLKEEMY